MAVINLSAKIGNILEDFSAKICMTLHDHSESEIIHVAYENIHWVLIVKAKLLERKWRKEDNYFRIYNIEDAYAFKKQRSFYKNQKKRCADLLEKKDDN